MDEIRFDSLTRTLTTAGSRRRALAAALSGALGLALGASSPEVAAAKKKCPPCKKRKQGKCKKNKPHGTACDGGSCQSGRCVATPAAARCPDGFTTCGEQCVILADDLQHCGDCATACTSGEACLNGVCTCEPVFGSCGGSAFCHRGTLRCESCHGTGGSCSIGGGIISPEACCSHACGGNPFACT